MLVSSVKDRDGQVKVRARARFSAGAWVLQDGFGFKVMTRGG